MEKFMQRENVYLGFGSSPKTPNSEDMDFNDVFGGPPKRFSMQEVKARYSFGETVECEEEKASPPWSALKEKPVFGEEITPRRRHQQGDDFFDDIFKGGGECYSSPRRGDRDGVFGSNPGSRIMSPARPLPPKADPFGTSLPAQFSLPAKLTKATEYPTFGSHNHGQQKVDSSSTNGLNSPHSSSPLTRFSNQAIRSHDDQIRNEVLSLPRQSPLSYESSVISEDLPSTVTSDQKDNIETKKDTRNVDNIFSQFHFSIYKWAGRGVPMLMPLVVGNNLKSKDTRRYDKCASSNGRMEGRSSTVKKQDHSAAESESLKTGHVNQDLRSKKQTKELEKALYEFLELKSESIPNDTVVSGGARQSVVKEEQVKSLDESDVRERIEKEAPMKKSEEQVKPRDVRETIKREVPVKKTESLKPEIKKPLHAFLNEGDQPEMKGKRTKTPGAVHAKSNDSKSVKENGGTRIDSSNGKVEKSSFKGVAKNLGTNQVKKSVGKGKVKEFVQIFNQEAESKPKTDGVQRSRSTGWRNAVNDNENEVSSNAAKAKEQVNLHYVSFKVDENLKNDEAQRYSPTKTPSYTSDRSSTNPQKTFSSAENSDDPLEDNFLVQELSDGHEDVTQRECSEDTKAIDAKIRQWSVGKNGNIRSLLSTLQYVLWPESGWKPVPLVDLIEANSVKRAYQKALLRLHPDKLQQKGAAFHHKYIAEKVFDILQEAWDHFNTCSLTV